MQINDFNEINLEDKSINNRDLQKFECKIYEYNSTHQNVSFILNIKNFQIEIEYINKKLNFTIFFNDIIGITEKNDESNDIMIQNKQRYYLSFMYVYITSECVCCGSCNHKRKNRILRVS